MLYTNIQKFNDGIRLSGQTPLDDRVVFETVNDLYISTGTATTHELYGRAYVGLIAAAADTDKRNFYKLLGYNAKTAFVCYLLITVPLLIFAQQIIGVWLGQVPEYVVVFLFAISPYYLQRSVHELVNQFFISIGEMKGYQIIEIGTMALIVPVAWLLLHDAYPFWTAFMCMAVFELLNHACTVCFACKRHGFPLRYFRPMPWQELKNLFYIGIPAMSENISYCLSQVVITYFINQISNEALATRAYCHNMIMFVYLFCLSITQGGDILVGHLVGQRRHQAAYILGNYFFRWSMIITLTGSIILALTGKSILSAFTDNAEIIKMGVWVLFVDIILEVGRTANIFAGSTLRATGDTVYPFVIGVIFQWSVAVGVSYVIGIPLGFGLVGMWVGFALDENIRGVILVRRWRSGKWRTKGFVK